MNLIHPANPHVAPAAVNDRPEAATAPGRILVVDDDDMIRELLVKGLRRADYCVSWANNGETGWDTLCVENFDLLITDHEMPRLTGLNLLRRVRLSPLKVPVILMSGNLPWGEEDLIRLLPPGVAMGKPFFLVEMLRNIQRLLQICRAAGKGDGGLAGNLPDGGSLIPG